jgi:Protein of unknown function (DUF3892)
MAQNIRIECINKSDRMNPHERIRNVAGGNPDGTRWKLTQPAAIAYVEEGKYSFYVDRPQGDRVGVVIAVSQYQKKVPKDDCRRGPAQQSSRASRVPLTQRAKATQHPD